MSELEAKSPCLLMKPRPLDEASLMLLSLNCNKCKKGLFMRGEVRQLGMA
jgi:hypothetical protein